MDARGGTLQQVTEMVATSPTHSIAWRSAVAQQVSPISPQRDEDTPEKAMLRESNFQLARQLQNAEYSLVETTERAEQAVEATNNQARNAMLRQRAGFEHEASRFESVARQVAEAEATSADPDARQMLQGANQRHHEETSNLLSEIAKLQSKLAEVNDSNGQLQQQSVSEQSSILGLNAQLQAATDASTNLRATAENLREDSRMWQMRYNALAQSRAIPDRTPSEHLLEAESYQSQA